MSSFDHPALIHGISQSLSGLRKTQPEVMQAFGQLSKAAMSGGAVDELHKELMALAIGITQRCSGCIGFHVKALRRLGCTRQQLDETLAVCVYMGGGPALMYAAEAAAAWDAFAPPAA
jgi:AhpD family alkylhydroperoxidase